MGHTRRGTRLAVIAAALLVVAGCTASRPAEPAAGAVAAPPPAPAGAPRHLQGVPLAGPTGLRLLVASDPPRLLDVDRGTSRPVGGIPAGQDPFSVSEVGRNAVVAGDRQVFVLRRGASRATPVGRGGHAVGSLDGRGVWLLEHGRRCTLREVEPGRPQPPAGPAGALHHRPARRHPARAARLGRARRRRRAGRPARPRHRPCRGPLSRGPRGGGRPGPVGRPRAKRRPADPDRPAHRRPPPGGPPDPARPGRPGAGQPRRAAAGRRVRRPVLGPGQGPGLRHLAAGPAHPELAAAAGHAPDHRGEVHEHGLDRRRAAGAGGRLRAVRRGPGGVAARPGPAGRQRLALPDYAGSDSFVPWPATT